MGLPTQKLSGSKVHCKKVKDRTSLVAQWLRLYASSAGSVGSVPGQGTEIPHAVQRGRKTKIKFKKENV